MYIIVSKEPKVHWDRYLYWAGAVFSILGVTQYVLYPDLRNLSYAGWDPHFYRLFSTILDPNFAGIIIVVTFFLGIYMYQELRYRYLILFVQCMILVSLILTLSRSSWIAFIFPFIWFIWKKRIWYLMGILAVFIIALFFLPLPYKQITPVLRQESSMARLNNWIFSIRLIQKKPILGYGFNLLGSHKPVSLVYDGMQLSHSSSGLDNSFLFVFATTGIVGGIAWIYLIYTLWHIKISDTQKKRSLLHIFRMSLVAIGIHSLFINSQFFPWIMIWVWTLAGVIEHSKRLRNSMK